MPRRTLASLGTSVRERRGARKLRGVAKEIGIGPATLMRVENGRVPDIATFAKLCRWLGEDPGSFLGFQSKSSESPSAESLAASVEASAHLKMDQTPTPETLKALAAMILLAARRQRGSAELTIDGDV